MIYCLYVLSIKDGLTLLIDAVTILKNENNFFYYLQIRENMAISYDGLRRRMI